MKTLITLSLLIGTLLPNIDAQQVTFQSYMSTTDWVESVTLNGNVLNESSQDVFDIPSEDVLPGTNIIEFTSSLNNLNGVTSLDLVLIQRALINVTPLMPDGIIPADFDKSGYIGVGDLTYIAANILGLLGEIENAFIHPSVDLSSLDPFDFGTDIYKFEFQGEDIGTTSFVFDVYIHGDVNMTAFFGPDGNAETEVRQSNAIVTMENINLLEGLSYQIPFSIESNEPIEAFQFSAEVDGIQITDITTEDFEDDLKTNITDENAKMIVVRNEPTKTIEGVFSITANRDGMLSELLSKDENFFDEIVYSNLSTAGLDLEFRNSSSIGELSLDDLTLSPNPMMDEMQITFPAVANGKTTIAVSNVQGQLLLTKLTNDSMISLTKEELHSAGVYILSITQNGRSVQKKFIVL